MHRIGFCCKTLDPTGAPIPELNFRGTTVAWLNRQTPAQAQQRLWQIMCHNLNCVQGLIQRLAQLPESHRLVRLGSDLLPVFTEPTWCSYWQQTEVRSHYTAVLAQLGQLARASKVRLSFHPGQFCVLASESEQIRQRSCAELEYHALMAQCMGYGASWHDSGFKINIHLTGRAGVQGFAASLRKLSDVARNLITVENDEYSSGLDTVLQLESDVALVLDLHHHWCRTGEYLDPADARVQRVQASWRGVRPALHYSLSRESVLVQHSTDQMPCRSSLQQQGFSTHKLRAHSDYYWNQACNQWALSFLPNFDLVCESKAKNLASDQLLAQLHHLNCC